MSFILIFARLNFYFLVFFLLQGLRSQTNGRNWTAEVKIPKSEHRRARKSLCLGTFSDTEDAARVVDRACLVVYGRNAKLNFPVEYYDTDPFMLVRIQFN